MLFKTWFNKTHNLSYSQCKRQIYIIKKGKQTIWTNYQRWEFPLKFDLMAYLYCTRTGIPTGIQIPNPMATLYYAEHVHVPLTQTQIFIQTWIPNRYCTHFWGRYLNPDQDPSLCPAMWKSHKTQCERALRANWHWPTPTVTLFIYIASVVNGVMAYVHCRTNGLGYQLGFRP